MNVIVCIDNNKGMLFNHRRISKDEVVIRKIKEISEDQLWIRAFSLDLFPESDRVNSDMILKANKNDFCFVEDLLLSPYIDKIEKLYIFHWNRNYPSDFKFDLDYSKDFLLQNSETFIGKSHEKIRLEVYKHV